MHYDQSAMEFTARALKPRGVKDFCISHGELITQQSCKINFLITIAVGVVIKVDVR